MKMTLLAAVIVLAGFVLNCGDDKKQDDSTTANPTSTSTSTPPATDSDASAK